MIKGLISLILLVGACLTGAALAQDSEISFSVRRDGEFIRTQASVDLPASPALAWAVLTDYENYPRFISSMRESAVVERRPEGLVVEQKGGFSFLFFAQAVETRLLVSESPPTVIESRALAGDFSVMEGHYELLPSGQGVRLTFAGRLVPKFSLPPIIGMRIMRYMLLKNFREMVDEIARRDALVRRPSPQTEALTSTPRR